MRVSPLVLNNDFYHPVHLARELASIDRLSDGRLEVGIGAGHAFTEYAAIGQQFDPPGVRKARLFEAVQIIAPLLRGEEVSFSGKHYQVRNVRVMSARQTRVPLLIAVNGRAALAQAVRFADSIGLTMLGRTLEDGQRHEVRWQLDRLDRTIAFIGQQSASAGKKLELNALVQRVIVTGDRAEAARELVAHISSLSVEDALETPFLAIGTHDQIAAHLLRCRERWGISYFSVRDLDAFAPVIERLRYAERGGP